MYQLFGFITVVIIQNINGFQSNCLEHCICHEKFNECKIVTSSQTICMNKWRKLELQINDWNKINKITFIMCDGLEFLTIFGQMNSINSTNFQIINNGFHDLQIINTYIEYLPDYVFQHLKSLINIRINMNRYLTELSSKFTENLLKLELLDLSYNNIKDVSNSFQVILPNLKILKLNNNQLISLSQDTFLYLRELKVLDLSSNQIKVIKPFSFRGLIEVVNLNLFNNTIINFSYLEIIETKNLRSLDLSFNKIAEIFMKSCEHDLEVVNLSYNQLTVLPVVIVENCKNLKTIMVNNNSQIKTCVSSSQENYIFNVQNLCQNPTYLSQCSTVVKTSSSLILFIILIILCICLLLAAIFIPMLLYHKRIINIKKLEFTNKIDTKRRLPDSYKFWKVSTESSLKIDDENNNISI